MVYKLNAYFGEREIFEQDGSIEHILPEITGEHALNIGNLILLEREINNDAGSSDYVEKKIYYKKSQYLWISKFVEKYGEWNDDMIDERAKNLAAAYYGGILEKKLPSDVNIGEYI